MRTEEVNQVTLGHRSAICFRGESNWAQSSHCAPKPSIRQDKLSLRISKQLLKFETCLA